MSVWYGRVHCSEEHYLRICLIIFHPSCSGLKGRWLTKTCRRENTNWRSTICSTYSFTLGKRENLEEKISTNKAANRALLQIFEDSVLVNIILNIQLGTPVTNFSSVVRISSPPLTSAFFQNLKLFNVYENRKVFYTGCSLQTVFPILSVSVIEMLQMELVRGGRGVKPVLPSTTS